MCIHILCGCERHVVCICVSMSIYVHLWFVQGGLNSEEYQWVSFILPVMLYLFVMANFFGQSVDLVVLLKAVISNIVYSAAC